MPFMFGLKKSWYFLKWETKQQYCVWKTKMIQLGKFLRVFLPTFSMYYAYHSLKKESVCFQLKNMIFLDSQVIWEVHDHILRSKESMTWFKQYLISIYTTYTMTLRLDSKQEIIDAFFKTLYLGMI